MYVSIGELSEYIGVSPSTLRRWEKAGKILSSYRTKGGHRRFNVHHVKRALGIAAEETKRKIVCYARVSSQDQKEDLERQSARLVNYCHQSRVGHDIEVIKDLGSGLNYKKRGLKKLLRGILSGQISEVVITHKDRLLRFGSEIVFLICHAFDTKVSLIEEEIFLTDEESLARDVLEILTVFSARLYGKRAHKNRKRVHKKLVDES